MPDSFTETSHTGYGRRVGNSIKGMLFGGIMFLASFPILAWNEGRAVKEINTLEEGRKLVVNINAESESPQTNGMLVFTSGKATTEDVLEDEEFGISETALKLRRTAEMYQWEEDKDTSEDSNGNKKTTYNYKKTWSEKLISSSGFRYRDGHENPGSMPFQSASYEATEVTVGVHVLSPGLLSQISHFTPVALNKDHAEAAPEGPRGQPFVTGGLLYYGKNEGSPEIGDIRVKFTAVKPLNVSLIARQSGNTFGPFATKAGNSIELLEEGLHDSNYVIEAALSRNAMYTWILRAVGWFMMFFGLCLILGPLTTLTGVIPIVGSVVGLGVGIAAFVLASVLSLVTVAVSWIVVRPVAAIILLAVCGAFIWGAKKRGDKKIVAAGGVPGSAMPPPPPPPSPQP